MSYIAHHPGSLIALAFNTFSLNGKFYYYSFVGVLGWLDTYFDQCYYRAAFLMLVAALAASALNSKEDEKSSWTDLSYRFAILTTVALIFASLYLAWSAVGNPIVREFKADYLSPYSLYSRLFFLPYAFGGNGFARGLKK